MQRAVAVKLNAADALAIVVRSGGAVEVEAAVRVTWAEGADAKSIGAAVAAALEPYRLGRAPAIAVAPRSGLSWQMFDLPPAPPEDLPDLVHMQAQREAMLADEDEGFDFLPLSGDAEHPYRVLAVGLPADRLARLRAVCDAADLRLQHLVPEPLGWPEIGRRIAPQQPADGLSVFAAAVGRQAVVWAQDDAALRLMRTVWLPAEADAAADAAALAGELRRTQLALSQSHAVHAPPAHCIYCGEHADAIAAELSRQLARPVTAAALAEVIELPAAPAAPIYEVAPIAALALAAAERRTPLVDLLHPRRRPAPPSRSRTYVLAAVAATAAVAMIAWQGYQRLQAPLDAAETARAEIAVLEPQLAVLAEDEKKAAAVRDWIEQTPSLLLELENLSKRLRPEPLDSESFQADEDLVLTKLELTGGALTLDAVAKSNAALQPVERRLRAAGYRVDRGPVEPKAEGVPGYSVKVTAVVQRIDESAAAGEEPAP